MFLKNPKLLFNSSSFRLITIYTIFFVVSSLAINLYVYTVISSFIYKESRSEIEQEILQFNNRLRGTSNDKDKSPLEEHHKKEHHEGEHHKEEHKQQEHSEPGSVHIRGEIFEGHNNSPYFVRLLSSSGDTRYFQIPGDWDNISKDFVNRNVQHSDDGWTYLQNGQDKNKYEIRTFQLVDGSVIQMGHRIEEREDLLSKIRRVYFLVIIPIIILGYLGGIFVADRALNPIKQLINTLNSIVKNSNLDVRVPEQHVDKVHDELISLFNNMLNKIEYLITSMRNVLDNVAHDIRTPMTRLRGTAELAIQSEQSELHREALADCIEESERIQIMLNTIMDLSEAETGTMKLNTEELDIVTVISDVIELYCYVAEDKNITVHSSCPEHLFVNGDSNRLHQVMANLLDNAIKYSPPEGAIHIEANGNGREVVITVKDKGRGISEDDLDFIWDRLYRGDKSRTERGLGLGLSLVKAVVGAHNGNVEVSSTPGVGSTFSVYLPC